MHGTSQNLMGKGFETRLGHDWEAGLGPSPNMHMWFGIRLRRAWDMLGMLL